MAQFRPDQWLDRWTHVGSVAIAAGRVSLVADLDGNAAEQQACSANLTESADGVDRSAMPR